METKNKYFRYRGKRRIIYLQERHCGYLLKDCLGTTDEQIALIRRREIHIAVERGEYKSWKKTFEVAIDESFPAMVAGKAASTRKSYRVSVYNHLVPWFTGVRLSDIGRAEMSEYKTMREDQGIGEVGMKRELWLLCCLVRRYGRELMPLREAYRHPHRPVDHFPEEAEVLSICGAISNIMYRAVALTSAYSGIRRGDVLQLRWAAIDFASGFIRFRQQKTGRWIRSPLHPKLIDAINLMPRGLGNVRVFPGATGPGLEYHWQKAKQAVDLKWVRFHDLRHFYLSFLSNAGVHPLQLKDLGGHTSIKSTERYVHSSDQSLKDAVQVFVPKPYPNQETESLEG
ncbi:MAG: site-specific integrase [Nitrospinae bacterium]|nr:site-specific integrase [Nitrospinota bacterium]